MTEPLGFVSLSPVCDEPPAILQQECKFPYLNTGSCRVVLFLFLMSKFQSHGSKIKTVYVKKIQWNASTPPHTNNYFY